MPEDLKSRSQLRRMAAQNPDKLIEEIEWLRAALELIAAPKRPDGTYNRSREACEILARAALEKKS